MRPGLFSLLLLVGANPGIAQIDLANQLSVDKASIVALIDRLSNEVDKLPRRQLGGIDLLNRDQPIAAMLTQIHPQTVGSVDQGPDIFIENENG